MRHRIEFSREAVNDLDHLHNADRRLAQRVFKKIESLETSPRQGKPLVGNHAGDFSLRIGSYRVGYMPDTKNHTVFILTIKHRKHVY